MDRVTHRVRDGVHRQRDAWLRAVGRPGRERLARAAGDLRPQRHNHGEGEKGEKGHRVFYYFIFVAHLSFDLFCLIFFLSSSDPHTQTAITAITFTDLSNPYSLRATGSCPCPHGRHVPPSLTHSPTHPLAYSLTHSLPSSLAHSPTHSLAAQAATNWSADHKFHSVVPVFTGAITPFNISLDAPADEQVLFVQGIHSVN